MSGRTTTSRLVNATKVAIFGKAGTLLLGPVDLSGIWPPGNCAADAGDPIVNYDPLADRWLLAQFNGPNSLCLAVSLTADPLGSYYAYEFLTTDFPDYFKIGVWPDGYYVSTNEIDLQRLGVRPGEDAPGLGGDRDQGAVCRPPTS